MGLRPWAQIRCGRVARWAALLREVPVRLCLCVALGARPGREAASSCTVFCLSLSVLPSSSSLKGPDMSLGAHQIPRSPAHLSVGHVNAPFTEEQNVIAGVGCVGLGGFCAPTGRATLSPFGAQRSAGACLWSLPCGRVGRAVGRDAGRRQEVQ